MPARREIASSLESPFTSGISVLTCAAGTVAEVIAASGLSFGAAGLDDGLICVRRKYAAMPITASVTTVPAIISMIFTRRLLLLFCGG